ncbi:MAG TPA: hypothetical protein VIM11_00735 [Tepidisphaeraceae bacterium]|jgi:hypothetical protein
MKRQTRREFMATAAQVAAASAAATALLPGCATQAPDTSKPLVRPKVALVATVVRKLSHAQHFLDRLLEGYGWHGEHHHPPMELVSMYVDQFPETDLARERSKRHSVPIYPTIAEALTRGGSKLAVDGILIIAEHGEYPKNEMGQTLYPRYPFFKQCVSVFEGSGRAVPVFNDKHLSTDWNHCVEMVADSKRLGFPFLAGSSLPVTWRIPSIELPLDTPLEESVCVCYGGVDSYDFHGLETAQCMSERRPGGEVGIKSVLALKGSRVCDLLDERPATRRLVFAAMARSHTCVGSSGYTYSAPDMAWLRQHSAPLVGYFIKHRDGFKTAMIMMNGLLSDFTYAGSVRGSDRIVSCQMYLPMPPTNTSLADFFNPLMNNIERMMLDHKAPYPVERTLLTSGMTLACVTSLHRGQTAVQTPEMNVAYRAANEPAYWRT